MVSPRPAGVYSTKPVAGSVQSSACPTPSMPMCNIRHVVHPILSQRNLAPQFAHGGNHIASTPVVVSTHVGRQVCPNQVATARMPMVVQRAGPAFSNPLSPACVQVRTLPATALAATQSEARACPSPVRGILVKSRSLSQSTKKGVAFGMRYSANIDELEESVGKRISVVELEKQQRRIQELEEERRMLMLQTEVIEEGDFSGEFSGGRPRSRSEHGYDAFSCGASDGISNGGGNSAPCEGGGGGRRRSTAVSGEEELDGTKSMGRNRSSTAASPKAVELLLQDDSDDSSESDTSEVWEGEERG